MVREGFSREQKRLPPVLFYDAAGSALFEKITETPEYYPTRTELAILASHGDGILDALPKGHVEVVELGAGSAAKTETLLRTLLARQGHARYFPIDVSESALEEASARLARNLPQLEVQPIVGRNRAALASLPPESMGPRLVLFLGSSIGNHEPDEAAAFLRDVGASLRPQDRLLLGTDLVKDPRVLEKAYDDAAGVTAQFNLNVLVRLNRELGANFDLESFRHVARYDADQRRIEMHLESTRAQTVVVPGLGAVRFAEGETLHTENSYKYSEESVLAMCRRAGVRREAVWTDPRKWFALHLIAREDA